MNLKEIESAWNSEADAYNQWDSLGLDEKIKFAQKQARIECAAICRNVAESSSMIAGWSKDYLAGREIGAIRCSNEILDLNKPAT